MKPCLDPDQSSQKRVKRPLPLRRKLLFLGIILLALLGLLEGLSFVLYRIVDGASFSYRRVYAEQITAEASTDLLPIENEKNRARQASSMNNLVLHPYIGFVITTDSNKPGLVKRRGCLVNKFGFIDSDLPIQKRSHDKVIIGVVGGSVAFWFTHDAGDLLTRELGAYPYFKGKEIQIVSLAMGGLKQPQQLMTLNYMLALGGEFDLLINLDGYNEATLPYSQNYTKGVFPFFPTLWYYLTQDIASPKFQSIVGKLVFARKLKAAWARGFIDWSTPYLISSQLVWKIGDRKLDERIGWYTEAIKNYKEDALSFAAAGPGVEDFTMENLFVRMTDVWHRCSVQLMHLCRANGIEYFHFLQPNQYLKGSKPMGPEELKVAIKEDHPHREGVEKCFPLMRARAQALHDVGVRFYDMTQVFREVEEPLYYDNMCHFDKWGNEILAGKIAEIIGPALATKMTTEAAK